MESIRSYWMEIIGFVVLICLPFVFPPISINPDASGTLITATTAIFAIVAGFFIADSMSNYLRLQTLISEENAALIALAENATQMDEKNALAVHDAIDYYMIAQLNHGSLDHVLSTQSEVDMLRTSTAHLIVKKGDEHRYDHLLTMYEKILSCREEVALTAKKNLTPWHWLILSIFALLVLATVLSIRDGSLALNIFASGMAAGVFGVMILLRDMDNNRLLERKLGFDNPKEVFHALNRPPFYPHQSKVSERIPDYRGQFRICRNDTLHENLCELVTVTN